MKNDLLGNTYNEPTFRLYQVSFREVSLHSDVNITSPHRCFSCSKIFKWVGFSNTLNRLTFLDWSSKNGSLKIVQSHDATDGSPIHVYRSNLILSISGGALDVGTGINREFQIFISSRPCTKHCGNNASKKTNFSSTYRSPNTPDTP